MATVRVSSGDAQDRPDDVDWAKVHATTEADIQRQAEEDESDTETLGEPRYIRRGGVEVIPPARIRRIREKLGPTQSAFAKRFGLSERTVAEWELGRQSPTGPALVLLRVIECEPEAVERALKAS
jgi:putative transcriptional regulator